MIRALILTATAITALLFAGCGDKKGGIDNAARASSASTGPTEKPADGGTKASPPPAAAQAAALRDTLTTDPRDGQTYRTVAIGNRRWMSQNLNFKTDNSLCYDNDNANCAMYGRLYTWKAAMSACPKGWYLPSRDEWDEMAENIEDKSLAGKKLKSKTGWKNRDDGESGSGTDELGFSALPGGIRGTDSDDGKITFYGIGSVGGYWSNTESGGGARSLAMGSNLDYVDKAIMDKEEVWISVRCVEETASASDD